MAPVVTIARYRDITGDETSASAVIEDALVDAQALLEEDLRRPLGTGTRTERCRIFAEARGAAVYPAATPIASVSSPSGTSIVGHAVLGGTPLTGPPYFLTDPDGFATVTYVGGYDPTAVAGDADYLPVTLQRAIAWAAKAIIDPDAFAPVPAGATSASVGDVSLTWGPGGSPAQGEVTFSPSLVRRWRRRLELVT